MLLLLFALSNTAVLEWHCVLYVSHFLNLKNIYIFPQYMCLSRSASRCQKYICVNILSGLMGLLYLSFVYLATWLKEFAVFDICVQTVGF